ncbi:hypothetical protein SAMN04489724_1044 [Algoriphagus locisalis]|uniref:Uncharacterized protein n=1 Tax=Algoriphagus locisalis TaxID=305507 RepID=A0A1I6YJJ0_9BACT|nr:hypothetical protein [Algoriphagus locisalis]SFT50527.1 hypothetical protein SAMN04489724_1044 [Algoriphagus locisalis]
MKNILKIISFVALVVTLAPSFLVFKGIITPELSKTLMLIGTIVWFVSASFWMNKSEEGEEEAEG